MLLSDAITHYLSDRKVKGVRPNTLRSEASHLRLLLADVGNIQTHNLRPQHFDIFWSKRTTWSAGTMNLARDHLSTFVKWCQVRSYITGVSPLEGTRKMRVPERARLLIPQQEFETFLDTTADPRARIMCAVGLYLFTRISETAGLRWQDINLHANRVEVFRDKTQKVDSLPLCEELGHELRRWQLAYAAEIGRQVQPGDYVVPGYQSPKRVGAPGRKGTWVVEEEGKYLPRTKAHLAHSIRRELQRAGFYQPHEGGHTLRRSGAVALYDQLTSVGHDRAIRICQAMLGHAHITTTETYLRLDLDRKVRNEILSGRRMFPGAEEAVVLHLKEAE